MKKTFSALLLTMLVGLSGSALARDNNPYGTYGYGNSQSQSGSYGTYGSDHQVRGHYRSNGTYVDPYRATNPNSTRNDNYSTQGNVNPYTGQYGTKPRDGRW